MIRDFKSILEDVRADSFKIIIRANKEPPQEHERCFNAPMTPEVAALIVGTVITGEIS